VSARVYAWPRGIAATSVSRGSAQWRDHDDEVLKRARERLAASLEAVAYHRDELRAAQANAETHRQHLAWLESKISPRPEPRANETPGSPTHTEGDPDESA